MLTDRTTSRRPTYDEPRDEDRTSGPSPSRHEALLELGRGATSPYRAPDPIARLKRVSARRANHPALVCGQDSVSYGELAERVARLATRLRELGVVRGSRVAMYLGRGVDAPLAMLATWAAGGAYVPLDPTHPEARVRMILEDARPEVLISERALLGTLDVPEGIRILVLDEERARIAACTPMRLTAPADGEQLAYVLFTSGSTGRPKGVGVPRRAIANFLRSMAHTPGMDEGDRLLSVTTVTFDIAGLELFLPLWVGATVHIADRDDVLDPERLRALIISQRITVLQATPVTFRLLLDAGLGEEAYGMKVLCGGEAMSKELAQRLNSVGVELWNMYGPTETTVWSTLKRVGPEDTVITVGRPIDETQLYIMNEKLELVPRGDVGELCIGGVGVALGYFERDDLTTARFVQNPYGPPGDRIYRTGDLARFTPNGEVECLGRLDHQVKIRGFRIELGEIESALRAVPGVKDACVVARGEASEPMLVGYLIGDAQMSDVREHVRGALPDYMQPSAYVVLDAFPLNTNGKIDRKALPAPVAEVIHERAVDRMFGTDEELILSGLVEEVLGLGQVQLDQDLYALGATSLKLVQLRNRIREQLDVDVPLNALFEGPTVAQLAKKLGRRSHASHVSFVRLVKGADDLPPLLCLMGIALYRDLAQNLGDGRSVYGIHVPFQPKEGETPRVKDLAKLYVDAIVANVPRGPYHLAGLCFGGILAFEVAHQLRERGREVGSVSLFDANLPRAEHYSALIHARELAKGSVLAPMATFSRLRQRFGSTPPVPMTASGELARDGEFDVDGPLAKAMVQAYDREVTPIDVPLLVCRAAEQSTVSWRTTDEHQGWLGMSPQLEVETVPGSHLQILSNPAASITAAAVRRVLSMPRYPRARMNDWPRMTKMEAVGRRISAP